jgi:hypothetical protein
MQPKTKTIIFILLSYLLGILCGWFLEDRIFPSVKHSQNRGPGDFQNMLVERLHLNDQQAAQVDSILETRRLKMDVFRKQAIAMRDTIRMEISKILNADQKKLFNEIIQDIDSKEAKRHEHEKEK